MLHLCYSTGKSDCFRRCISSSVLKQKIPWCRQYGELSQPPVETQQESWFCKFIPFWQHGHYIAPQRTAPNRGRQIALTKLYKGGGKLLNESRTGRAPTPSPARALCVNYLPFFTTRNIRVAAVTSPILYCCPERGSEKNGVFAGSLLPLIYLSVSPPSSSAVSRLSAGCAPEEVGLRRESDVAALRGSSRLFSPQLFSRNFHRRELSVRKPAGGRVVCADPHTTRGKVSFFLLKRPFDADDWLVISR